MKSRFLFLFKYYVFWLLIFICQKILFMVFNIKESGDLNLADWVGVLWHGLRLDLSAGGYLMVFPTILLIVLSLFSNKLSFHIMNVYTCIFLFIILFLGVLDMELYSYWGFKLDMTPLLYLKTPKEAVASVNYLEMGSLVLLITVLFFLFLFIYRKMIAIHLKSVYQKNYLFSMAGLLIFPFLFIPIRGGISIAPVNISSAYFHSNRFANHSAVNVLWNVTYSFIERDKLRASYRFMDDDTAVHLFNQLYPDDLLPVKVVKDNSNVIMIILESFSNRIIGALGGEKGITPELDKIIRESIVFSNFFATGDRSDKGIVGIFSGFPAQPTTSIINYPSKTQNLPFLPKYFHDDGYYTSFYYGGNINFANFRSYLTSPYIDRIVTLDDFPPELNVQKWGVPDEYLFEKILTDADSIKKPFFISCFTLSSHDPYDFPGEAYFGISTMDDKSKSGFYYTDHCIGSFISKAKLKTWWDNTLIIILSDHGSRSPGQIPNHVMEKFRIPMIWTGGAILTGDTVISKYSSQNDLSLTLLRQLNYIPENLKYSKDILARNSQSFAMYFFNNGFGLMSDSASLIYDNNLNKYILQEGRDTTLFRESARAYLQVLSDDFHSN